MVHVDIKKKRETDTWKMLKNDNFNKLIIIIWIEFLKESQD